MKIFISHSHQDRYVAREFKKLFESFNKRTEVFVSSDITGEQIKSRQWQKNFEENLKGSTHCVVLVTPNSLNSSWVHYEIGFAKARDINEIIPIGIKGVSPEDFFMKENNMQIVDDNDDVVKMLSNIFEVQEELSEAWCEKQKRQINELLSLCRERCVYFVGSDPTSASDIVKWNKERVKDFLGNLTTELVKKGIKVSSFPTVEEVGKIVFDSAIDIDSKKYEISGLYEFDTIADGKKIDTETWKQTLDGFRQLYLKNKSSMIIIGGKGHTKDEYKVAKKTCTHMEFFPLPCMGGFGKTLFDGKKATYEKSCHPCWGCDYKNKEQCDRIKEFVERLDKYIYIDDEDEREP